MKIIQKPKIGTVRFEGGIELDIYADETGGYAMDADGNTYPVEVRDDIATPIVLFEPDPSAYSMQGARVTDMVNALAEKMREPEEWTYAAPPPEERGRQAFKNIANKSSWSRHDGKRRRKHR